MDKFSLIIFILVFVGSAIMEAVKESRKKQRNAQRPRRDRRPPQSEEPSVPVEEAELPPFLRERMGGGSREHSSDRQRDAAPREPRTRRTSPRSEAPEPGALSGPFSFESPEQREMREKLALLTRTTGGTTRQELGKIKLPQMGIPSAASSDSLAPRRNATREFLLADRENLRRAIVLTEVFGAPRGSKPYSLL